MGGQGVGAHGSGPGQAPAAQGAWPDLGGAGEGGGGGGLHPHPRPACKLIRLPRAHQHVDAGPPHSLPGGHGAAAARPAGPVPGPPSSPGDAAGPLVLPLFLNPAWARSWPQGALDTCPLRGAFWGWDSEPRPQAASFTRCRPRRFLEQASVQQEGPGREPGPSFLHRRLPGRAQSVRPHPARPDTCPAQDAPKTSRAGSTCLSAPCGGATCSRAGAAAPSPWHRPGHRWLCAWDLRGARHPYAGGQGLAGIQPQTICPHPFQGLAMGGAGRGVRGGCPQRAVPSVGRGWDPIPAPGFSSHWAHPAGSQPHPFEGQRGGPAPIFPTGSPPPCRWWSPRPPSVQPGLGQQWGGPGTHGPLTRLRPARGLQLVSPWPAEGVTLWQDRQEGGRGAGQAGCGWGAG